MDTSEKYDRYVMTSFTAGIEPVVVASAEGARVVDADGRSYIDCFAGISVVNAGHGAPDVRQAAKEQIDRLIHCSSYTYYHLLRAASGQSGRTTGRSDAGPPAKDFLRQ